MPGDLSMGKANILAFHVPGSDLPHTQSLSGSLSLSKTQGFPCLPCLRAPHRQAQAGTGEGLEIKKSRLAIFIQAVIRAKQLGTDRQR